MFVSTTLFVLFLLSASAEKKPWESDYMLSKHVVPEVYNLFLNPDLQESKFTGTVDIALKITAEVDYIVIHSKNLTVHKSILSEKSNTKENLVKNAFAYPENEFWIIELNKKANKGSYKLFFEFSGLLTEDIFGFYRSTYKDAVTEKDKYIATTQFESTYARRAFLCFDEPSFKAKFNVSIAHPSGNNYIALSNMNQVSKKVDSPSKGLTTALFATSVPMSTYLACFIVCDFEHLPSKKSKHGFDVKVYARNGQIEKMQFALDNTISSVEFYIEYFSINYPLPKLDVIAIPDFAAGAMENWGLITYRETSVLYDPNYTTGLNLLSVTLTTSHELAHMWFGNLVTMKWWDDLWLNEGFASFMAFKGSAHVHPKWDLDTVFVWYYLSEALRLDSTLSSHPIVKHVSHPDQISEIFDSVSYSKGASVLRMMEAFLGEENFRQGVVSYLKTFSYKNAETKDLWHHLEKYSSGVNIERVMDTWTRQMGAPVLIVTQDGDFITIKQQRFTTDKKAIYDANESPYKYKWDVPVTYLTSENKVANMKWLLLDDPELKIEIGKVKWYKLNWHFMGYYRVSYPDEHWKTLAEVLLDDITVLDPADRANLVNDAFALAESGYLDYSIVLSLINFLQKEDHFVVWALASHQLLQIEAKLQHTPIYDAYRDYLKKIIKPLLKDSLWEFSEDQTIIQRSLQVKLLNLACKIEMPECLNKAKELFIDWLDNNGPKPHVEIQQLVYNYGIAKSDEAQWNKLWDRFVVETDPQEKIRLRNGLCSTEVEPLIKKLLDLAKNEQYVRSQDYFSLLYAVSANRKANPTVWEWLKGNWKYLENRFTLNSRAFGRLLPNVVENYDTEEKLKEVEQLLRDNPEEGAGASGRKSACETIKLNILWLNTYLPKITEALKNNM